jgi:hypothetical protein
MPGILSLAGAGGARPIINTAPSAGFNYFRRGEPQLAIAGTGAGGFDYFRRGEFLRGLW